MDDLALRYKSGEEVSNSVGLLISILIRYPEVGAINFDPDKGVLKFTFILSQNEQENVLKSFSERLYEALQTYLLLEGKEFDVIWVGYAEYSNITVLEIHRDLQSLSQEEMSLIVNLLHEEFHEDLLVDDNGPLLEEDLLVHEELIQDMLDDFKSAFPKKRLMAIREEGRVLVFNK
ncbi:hypothetical protein [Calderihabitans maritimus]|uniref:hypothetical protein n=1 Tax=Calderihabitans maritimus TaxID=1246530 RepID=UPI00192CFEEA|nr:hypothetical protein [Calderihabitans maritimus]